MLAVDTVRGDVIPAMVQRIVKRFHPLRIVLFGSYARGDEGKHSDVDLLVVMPWVTDQRKVTVEIRNTLSHFPVPKDVVVTTPDEIARYGNRVGTVLRPALREGKVLYERP